MYTLNSANNVASNNATIIKHNLDTLFEGASLLNRLPPEHYLQGFKPAFQSTIGAHYRHLLEHYQCLFLQLETRHFCYDSRHRQQILEQDKVFALEVFQQVAVSFEGLTENDFNYDYLISDEQSDKPVMTTLARELIFLQSHTVHHYAIIAAMARSLGMKTDTDFGVAIATKTFQNQSDNEIKEQTKCAP